MLLNNQKLVYWRLPSTLATQIVLSQDLLRKRSAEQLTSLSARGHIRYSHNWSTPPTSLYQVVLCAWITMEVMQYRPLAEYHNELPSSRIIVVFIFFVTHYQNFQVQLYCIKEDTYCHWLLKNISILICWLKSRIFTNLSNDMQPGKKSWTVWLWRLRKLSVFFKCFIVSLYINNFTKLYRFIY